MYLIPCLPSQSFSGVSREFLIYPRGTESKLHFFLSFGASVAIPFCKRQNLLLKNNPSKSKSMALQTIYSFTFAAYALRFN
jgi:hypothetical protein